MPQHVACARVPVSRCPARIPVHFIEALEQNQQIRSCCRHPENHDIEALYSSDADRNAGIPDIYVLHCTCGRRHIRQVFGGQAGPGLIAERDALDAEVRSGNEAKRERLLSVEQQIAKGFRPFWEIR
jgi:hypothetical protein